MHNVKGKFGLAWIDHVVHPVDKSKHVEKQKNSRVELHLRNGLQKQLIFRLDFLRVHARGEHMLLDQPEEVEI